MKTEGEKLAFLEGVLIGLYQELKAKNEDELVGAIKKGLEEVGVTIGEENSKPDLIDISVPLPNKVLLAGSGKVISKEQAEKVLKSKSKATDAEYVRCPECQYLIINIAASRRRKIIDGLQEQLADAKKEIERLTKRVEEAKEIIDDEFPGDW